MAFDAKLFRGGIPYGPDIKRLSDAFPVPELTEGRGISHEQLESIIGLKKGTARYYSVCNAWIGKLKSDNGIVLVWDFARGLKVLNPAEILEHAESKTKQKARQLRKATKLFAWVDRNRLDDTGKQRLDHQMIVAAKLAGAVQESQKELAIDLAPIVSLPKRKITA